MLYNIDVYGSACNKRMNKLQVQQNRSLKRLFQKHYSLEMKLLKVPAIKENVQIANMVYKHKQSILPPVFVNYFTWARELHARVTHIANKLHITQPKNENGITMIKYQGPYIWNKLPEAVTKSPRFPTFKRKLKQHYLELQNV